MRRARRAVRASAAGIASALSVSIAGAAEIQVTRGPYPDTALSRGGALVWYTGILDLGGRRWGEIDQICRSVPVPKISGWRAPTEGELRTLLIGVPRDNGIAKWTELIFANAAALAPAVPYFDPNARVHRDMNLVARDLYTYEGAPTTLARAIPGRMHVIKWFNRGPRPVLAISQKITFTPGDSRLGAAERLLCVAERRTAS